MNSNKKSIQIENTNSNKKSIQIENMNSNRKSNTITVQQIFLIYTMLLKLKIFCAPYPPFQQK